MKPMNEEMKKGTADNPQTEEAAPDMEETTPKMEETKEAARECEDTSEDMQEAEETEDVETASSNPAEDEKEGKADKKAKRKFRDKKQDALKEKIEELEDRVKRQMAEFENFRKRTEKEKTAMFETGAKSVIEKILPVVDNFERGLAAIPEEDKGAPFAEGMEMIYKQLISELEKMDVKPIPAVGEEFNPDFHNAVMQVESEEYESGIIAQELQKGYTYRDSVVRHSMVAVVG